MQTAVQGRGAPRVLPFEHEHALVLAVAGDECAFEVLVRDLSPPLTRFIERVLRGDADRASGVVQETWLAAWEHLRTFESADHLTRWLYRVARCRAISCIRSNRRMLPVPWNDEPNEELRLPSPAVPPHTDTASDAVHEVACAVSRLPDIYRGVATLHYLHGQSVAQVAVLLGLRRCAVKMRLHRARLRNSRRHTMNETTQRGRPGRDIYIEVTNRIVEALERGVAPWVRPWRTIGAVGGLRNAVSGYAYSGINVMLLGLTMDVRGFSDPRWLTYQQAKNLGGQTLESSRVARAQMRALAPMVHPPRCACGCRPRLRPPFR